MTPRARNEQSVDPPSRVKRLSGIWSTENTKIVRRVIISVVGATVLLIGVALLVLPRPAFIVIPIGLAILASEYPWARRWLKKCVGWRAALFPAANFRFPKIPGVSFAVATRRVNRTCLSVQRLVDYLPMAIPSSVIRVSLGRGKEIR